MKARLRFHQKITLIHKSSADIAVAELKVFSVPVSSHYSDGIKYSLFLASQATGEVIVGFDNHKPKEPHLHSNGKEMPYRYQGVDRLVEDFWEWVEREGYLP
jgi:hypothetical protein